MVFFFFFFKVIVIILNLGSCILPRKNNVKFIIKNYPPFNELNNCKEDCGFMYKCSVYGYCLTVDHICDGKIDCLLGDDEENCGKKN